MLHASRQTNIRVSYVLAFLSELYFPISVWLFFYLRYLDFKQVAVITAVQVIAQNLFEIPTGAFADTVGRKTAVFLSFLLYGAVELFIGFTSVFWAFVILELFRGLSASLYSGSLEALAYDTLKEEGKESEFDHVIANTETYAWIGLFLAAVTGGFLYFYNFRAPFLLQGLVYIIGALIALRLREPRVDTMKYSFRGFFRQNVAGFREIFATRRVAQISVVFIILGAGYFFASNLLGISQAREYGMDPRGVGFLFGTGYILSAIASQGFPKLKAWLGARKLLMLTAAILLTSFLFARYVGIITGSVLIIARIASSTTFRNSRSSILNRFIESKNRATAISTIVLLSQLPFALFAFFAGSYMDSHSPNSFALVLGIFLVILLLLQQAVFLGKNRQVNG